MNARLQSIELTNAELVYMLRTLARRFGVSGQASDARNFRICANAVAAHELSFQFNIQHTNTPAAPKPCVGGTNPRNQ